MIRSVLALLFVLIAFPACAAHNNYGLNMHRGGGSGGNCPQGTGVADGCLAANSSSAIRHSNFFSGYANQVSQTYSTRPPWNVAGVDYPVGHYTATGSLTDPAVTQPSGCTYSATGSGGGGPILDCRGAAALTISGYNFGPVGGHGATVLQIQDNRGANTVTITNNLFVSDDNSINSSINCPIIIPTNGVFSLVMTYNTLDNCSYVDTYCAVALSGSAALNASQMYDQHVGNGTRQYNAFLNTAGQVIRGGGTGTLTDQFNYIEGLTMVAANGYHGEYIIYSHPSAVTTGLKDTVVVSFNTCLIPTTSLGGITSCFYFSGGASGVFTASLAANVLTLSTDINTGAKRAVTLNDYVGASSFLPDGVQISSLITGTGNTGTYGVSGASGFSFSAQQVSTGLEFFNSTLDHNVIVANTRSGAATISAGLEFGYNIYNVSSVTNNYVDATGILSGRTFYSAGVNCTNPTTFNGNINLLNGAAINTWNGTPGINC